MKLFQLKFATPFKRCVLNAVLIRDIVSLKASCAKTFIIYILPYFLYCASLITESTRTNSTQKITPPIEER
jgi:hypothetical protein